MELRKIIRTDIAASALAHLTLVALIILISEVHPYHVPQTETTEVQLVSPEQLKQEDAKANETAEEKAKNEPPSEPVPDLKLPKLDLTDKSEIAPKPAPAPAKDKAPPQPAAKQKQAAREPQQNKPPEPAQAAKPPEATAQPQQVQPQALPSQIPPPPSQAAQPPPPASPQPQAAPPSYRPPEPDVTVKYGVMLGLPPELPAPAPKDAPSDDGGDAKDSIAAKLPPEIIAELRRHLRNCSKLPAGVAPGDAVRVKLRSVLASDGTLLREPILIEAPPSAKGVALMKAATSAIQACQPYRMLPASKYEEWKVLDLVFTPQDFGG